MCLFTHILGKEKAFTLVETALAIGLSAILATSVAPIFTDASRQAQLTSEDMVSGHVQTGITLKQMENLATRGVPAFPPALDTAPVGVIANSNNPFFNNVLQFPITSGWRKESALTYRSPTGRIFTYNPETGTFNGNGDATKPPTNNLGNIVYEYAGIAFYNTGAIVDTRSQMAYVPSLEGDQVTLTLASGVKIDTHEDGSALIALQNGEALKVADIHKPTFFQLPPENQNANEQNYSYLSVDNGLANEGTHSTVWHKREYQADAKGGSFHYEYDLSGSYSGGSLEKDYGFIYQSQYESPVKQISEGTWSKKENGNYEGTFKHSYDYDSTSRSGYSHPEAKYRYAFDQKAKSIGESESHYTYNQEKEVYQTSFKGGHQYEMDRDASSGPFKGGIEYDFEGTSEYDKKKETYKSETNYKYKDGRDLTYRYKYNDKDKTFEWSVTDNKSGKVTRQSNKGSEK